MASAIVSCHGTQHLSCYVRLNFSYGRSVRREGFRLLGAGKVAGRDRQVHACTHVCTTSAPSPKQSNTRGKYLDVPMVFILEDCAVEEARPRSVPFGTSEQLNGIVLLPVHES